MMRFENAWHGYGAYIRCAGHHFARREAVPVPARIRSNSPRVSIVDFRDEIYACLSGFFEEAGFQVGRVELAAGVDRTVKRFAPDLILVNEYQRDATGWFAACKFRLLGIDAPIWMYVARKPFCEKKWRALSGVDEVIEYEGVLSRLVHELCKRLYGRSKFATDVSVGTSRNRASHLAVAQDR